jgi:ABC-type sulfate transport system permease component
VHLESGNVPVAAALAVVMIACSLVIVFAVRTFEAR